MHMQFYITIEQDNQTKLWSAKAGELSVSDPKAFVRLDGLGSIDEAVTKAAKMFGRYAAEYVRERFKQ